MSEPHSIRFSKNDWQTIERLARQFRMKPNRFVNQVIQYWMAAKDHEWEGLPQAGGNRKAPKKEGS